MKNLVFGFSLVCMLSFSVFAHADNQYQNDYLQGDWYCESQIVGLQPSVILISKIQHFFFTVKTCSSTDYYNNQGQCTPISDTPVFNAKIFNGWACLEKSGTPFCAGGWSVNPDSQDRLTVAYYPPVYSDYRTTVAQECVRTFSLQ